MKFWMNNIFLCLTLIFFAQSSFTQTKFDEYEKTNSDEESARLDNFLSALNNEPTSKGLIVIYSGESKERLGNILRLQNGIKRYVKLMTNERFDDRLSILIAEGKRPLDKEFRIISKSENLPAVKSADVDLKNLKTKYLYAAVCLICEPVVPELSASNADMELYKKILEENANYGALVVIRPSRVGNKIYFREAKNFASDYRKILTKNQKINKNRITIKIENSSDEDSPATAELYLIPK